MRFTSELSELELVTFLELFRRFAAGRGNRFFVDLLFIVEREVMARHTKTEMKDYTDVELSEAIEGLIGVGNAMREEGKTDDSPDYRFITVALGSAAAELKRRS